MSNEELVVILAAAHITRSGDAAEFVAIRAWAVLDAIQKEGQRRRAEQPVTKVSISPPGVDRG